MIGRYRNKTALPWLPTDPVSVEAVTECWLPRRT